MAKANEHGKIIAAAAKRALVPLGLRRSGQSRIWYGDQRYWVIMIEFQPSGWAKGSYLNTGVNWLWSGHDMYCIHDRPGDFVPFEDAQQFAPLMDAMAARAANEVAMFRERFRTFDKILEYTIAAAEKRDDWPLYYAAVAAGLAGDRLTAEALFKRMADWPTYGYDWELELKARAAALARLLPNGAAFRSKVAEVINENRVLMKLPLDPNCLEKVGVRVRQ